MLVLRGGYGRQHEQGKLTARERIALLLDPRTASQEIGLLIAHDRYEGEAPAAGVVTGIGTVHDLDVNLRGEVVMAMENGRVGIWRDRALGDNDRWTL